MPGSQLGEYMSKRGWSYDFHLPISNEENCELEEQLEKSHKRRVALESEVRQECTTIGDLRGRIGRTTVLLENLRKMIQTSETSVQHARNLNIIAERSHRIVQREIGDGHRELNDFQKRNQTIHDELERKRRLVNRISADFKLNQNAIESINAICNDEENDIDQMSKYFKLDENAIKQGELEFRKLLNQSQTLKIQLQDTLSATRNRDGVLSNVISQFRMLHFSRNHTIELWKGVIQSLHARDRQLQEMGKEYASMQNKLKDLQVELTEKQALLTSHKGNLVDAQTYALNCVKSTSSLRLQLQKSKSMVPEFNAELNLMRFQVQRLSAEVTAIEKQRANSRAEWEGIADKEMCLRDVLKKVQEKYRKVRGPSSTDEKFRELGLILDFEEDHFEIQEKERNRRLRMLSQLKTAIGESNRELEHIDSLCRSKENQWRCSCKEFRAQYAKVLDRGSASYKLELAILCLEQRIKHEFMKIEEDRKPTHVTEEIIAKLKSEIQKCRNERLSQENINSHIESVITYVKREILQFKELGVTLSSKNDNLIAFTSSCNKRTLVAGKFLQETTVEFRMVLLRKAKLQNVIFNSQQQIATAEQNKVELEAASSKKRAEFQMHVHILEMQKHTLQDDRSKLVIRLKEIRSILEQWKTRYELIMTALEKEADAKGSTEAFFIVKVAQDREYLKREGEKWDQLVKVAEAEVEGLQNILALVGNTNRTLRTGSSPKANLPEEVVMTQKVIQRQTAINEKRRRELEYLLQDLKALKLEIHSLDAIIASARDTVGVKRQELVTFAQEIQNQEEKIDRSTVLTRRILKELGELSSEDRHLIECEIKHKCLQEKYMLSIKTLEKTIRSYPKLQPWLLAYFTGEKKILGKLMDRLVFKKLFKPSKAK